VIDLQNMAQEANPYPMYETLRSWGRVVWLEQIGRWLVTGHRAALAILRHPQFSSDRSLSDDYRLPEGADRPPGGMFVMDPPAHTRLRTLVQKAFTPRMVTGLRPRVEQLVDQMLTECGKRGEVDLMADFAMPLPATILAELLGIPARNQSSFLNWTRVVVESIDPVSHNLLSGDGVGARRELERYLTEIIDDRRARPRPDLISSMVHAEADGERLTADELLEMCFLLTVAGLDTTANLIGNGVNALLRNPDQLERLRADPALIESGVEELLRYDAPIQASGRIVAEDVEVEGHSFRAGQTVGILLGAANRDPEVFTDPDRLDLSRSPNNHISFGRGIHFCLGASLARMQGAIAIAGLVQRFPALHQTGDPQRRGNIHVRGFGSYPVALT
jgi:cytochrome P450